MCMNMIDRGYKVIEIVFGRSKEKVVVQMMMIDKMAMMMGGYSLCVDRQMMMIDKMVGYSLCVDR